MHILLQSQDSPTKPDLTKESNLQKHPFRHFIQKLLGKKGSEENTGGMQDYMTLVRVYFQASIAANVGITNLAMVPDLRVFKSSFHVPTVNNKLGIGEKKYCQKMMQEIYGVDDNFFKEIDQSIRKSCRKMQDVQIYLLQFQNFTQDLMMLTGNLMNSLIDSLSSVSSRM